MQSLISYFRSAPKTPATPETLISNIDLKKHLNKVPAIKARLENMKKQLPDANALSQKQERAAKKRAEFQSEMMKKKKQAVKEHADSTKQQMADE
jgi:hypothetical protein